MKQLFNRFLLGVFLLVTSLFISSFASGADNASSVEEAVLTVQGTGSSEEEATLAALRSAIEQTYGVFVSANTQILNDNLIRDEVVSVSSGNVKEYRQLSCVQMPNGQKTVTLKATVSISKLVSFARSKGSKAEFAGQTFAMDMKLKNLRIQNAKKAFDNMCDQIWILLNDAFDYEIKIDDPVKCVPEKLNIIEPAHYKEIHSIWSDAYEAKRYFWPDYRVDVCINVRINEVFLELCRLYISTLHSLSLNEDDRKLFYKLNLDVTPVRIQKKIVDIYGPLSFMEGSRSGDGELYLPFGSSIFRRFECEFSERMYRSVNSFDIIMNGVPCKWKGLEKGDFWYYDNDLSHPHRNYSLEQFGNNYKEEFYQSIGIYFNKPKDRIMAVITPVRGGEGTIKQFYDGCAGSASGILGSFCLTRRIKRTVKYVDLNKITLSKDISFDNRIVEDSLLPIKDFDSFLSSIPKDEFQTIVKENVPKELMKSLKKRKIVISPSNFTQECLSHAITTRSYEEDDSTVLSYEYLKSMDYPDKLIDKLMVPYSRTIYLPFTLNSLNSFTGLEIVHNKESHVCPVIDN